VVSALPRAWFSRPAPLVAAELLGRHLVRSWPDGSLSRVRLVETEAYEPDDPASHSFRGETPRTAAMFGPPGRLYVYLIYGVHHCLNVVTGPPGHGAAVLLRAGQPLDGLAAMAAHRHTDDVRLLCRGPARLAQALGLDRSHDGIDLLGRQTLWLEPGKPVPPDDVTMTTRIGISVGTRAMWRAMETGSAWATPTSAASRRSVAPRP
jgi:DNA-3-methyladenine glycosylase